MVLAHPPGDISVSIKCKSTHVTMQTVPKYSGVLATASNWLTTKFRYEWQNETFFSWKNKVIQESLTQAYTSYRNPVKNKTKILLKVQKLIPMIAYESLRETSHWYQADTT
ncbi:UNVERIFIED_CONTAM: hypothetical protein K2H54_040981 [Gekko kuhli]